MAKLQKDGGALSAEIAGYRQQAESRMAALAAGGGLGPGAKRELDELQLVVQAALAQVGLSFWKG